jgi:hypothetical protein
MIVITKIEVENLDGHNSFCLRHIKLQALLRQQGLARILDGDAQSSDQHHQIKKSQNLKKKRIVQFCCFFCIKFSNKSPIKKLSLDFGRH